MSIERLIRWRIGEGQIVPLRPRAPGTSIHRPLLLTEALASVLNSEHADEQLEERLGHLEADLEEFVIGAPIHPKYLFGLYPSRDGVWEIRSVRHDPSIRVLGLFARKDVFVATNHAFRDELGGWNSREWKAVKRQARARWRQLFASYEPLISTNVNDLVTGAINGKYFKP